MSVSETAVMRLVELSVVLLLFGGGLPGGLYAQEATDNPVGELQEQFKADSTQPTSSAELVSVEPRLAATPIPAGEAVRAALVLDVEEGWHVNAHRPTYDYLIGTTLDWDASSDLSIEETRYPEPKQFHLAFAGDTIDVYEGRSAIFATLRPAATATPGERRLTGRLRVQACDDDTCLRPSTVDVSVPVTVAAAGATAQPTGDPVFDETSAGTSGALMRILQQHGLFLAGGLLVLLTVAGLVVYGRLTQLRASD